MSDEQVTPPDEQPAADVGTDGGPGEGPAETTATIDATDASGANDSTDPAARSASPVRFPEVRGGEGGESASLDRIYDLKVPVTVELGRATLAVEEILRLAPGAVVELDRAADQPVEMFVHGKCVARGEIVVVDDFYGVRITSVG